MDHLTGDTMILFLFVHSNMKSTIKSLNKTCKVSLFVTREYRNFVYLRKIEHSRPKDPPRGPQRGRESPFLFDVRCNRPWRNCRRENGEELEGSKNTELRNYRVVISPALFNRRSNQRSDSLTTARVINCAPNTFQRS